MRRKDRSRLIGTLRQRLGQRDILDVLPRPDASGLIYRFARIGRRCFYHSFEYYGNVDAGPENIGTLVVLGGDRRGVGIVVLSAGFVSDLLFICMLWRISDCRMDQLEKERKVV